LAYSADAIENTDGVGLTRGGLLLFALLSGGDYSSGAAGCGPAVAHGLACSGFGDRLLQTYEDTGWDDLRAIPQLSKQWFNDLREELCTNTHGHLNSRLPALANHLAPTFLESLTTYMYVEGQTSWSRHHAAPDMPSICVVRPPNLEEITRVCFNNLGWTDMPELLKVFHTGKA